jgi:hypothetical protein
LPNNQKLLVAPANAETQARVSFSKLAEAGLTVIRLCEIKPMNHSDGLSKCHSGQARIY